MPIEVRNHGYTAEDPPALVTPKDVHRIAAACPVRLKAMASTTAASSGLQLALPAGPVVAPPGRSLIGTHGGGIMDVFQMVCANPALFNLPLSQLLGGAAPQQMGAAAPITFFGRNAAASSSASAGTDSQGSGSSEVLADELPQGVAQHQLFQTAGAGLAIAAAIGGPMQGVVPDVKQESATDIVTKMDRLAAAGKEAEKELKEAAEAAEADGECSKDAERVPKDAKKAVYRKPAAHVKAASSSSISKGSSKHTSATAHAKGLAMGCARCRGVVVELHSKFGYKIEVQCFNHRAAA